MFVVDEFLMSMLQKDFSLNKSIYYDGMIKGGRKFQNNYLSKSFECLVIDK